MEPFQAAAPCVGTCWHTSAPKLIHVFGAEAHMEFATTWAHSGVDLDAPLDSGYTPLGIACERGLTGMVTMLLDSGADASKAMLRSRITPLMRAAGAGHQAVVDVLLARGARVHDTMRSGTTALHCAAKNGFLNITRALLDHGADPNARMIHGHSPLLLAAQCKWVSVVELLISRGALPDVGSHPLHENGWTPLMWAGHHGSLGIVSALLHGGASVDLGRSKHDSAVRMAIGGRHWEILTAMLARSSPHGLAQLNAYEMLCRWLTEGRRGEVLHLLAAGASPHHPSLIARGRGRCQYQPPLTIAAAQGDLPMLLELLARGAPVDELGVGRHKTTALREAAREGQLEMMQALLTAGANPMALSGSCLVAACLGRHIDAVRLLLDSGVPAELGICAAAQGPQPVVALLLERGAAANQGELNRALAAACSTRLLYIDVVTALLRHGAHANTMFEERAGLSTPLLMASCGNHVEAIRVLLEHGADPDLSVPRSSALLGPGETFRQFPLFAVCERGWEHAAEALIAGGADVNQRQTTQLWCLQAAIVSNRLPVLRLLLDEGIDLAPVWELEASLRHYGADLDTLLREVERERVLRERWSSHRKAWAGAVARSIQRRSGDCLLLEQLDGL